MLTILQALSLAFARQFFSTQFQKLVFLRNAFGIVIVTAFVKGQGIFLQAWVRMSLKEFEQFLPKHKWLEINFVLFYSIQS